MCKGLKRIEFHNQVLQLDAFIYKYFNMDKLLTHISFVWNYGRSIVLYKWYYFPSPTIIIITVPILEEDPKYSKGDQKGDPKLKLLKKIKTGLDVEIFQKLDLKERKTCLFFALF